MIDLEELFENVDPDFEESIRIDRELETDDPEERREQLYDRYLDRYHLTDASINFLDELITHVHDENPGPDERNHWLYSYYGSGKSHLLTALDLLLDTETLEGADKDSVWCRFDDRGANSELNDRWRALHDDVLVVPLSINLLRYQSVREQTFSEIILQTVYAERGFADRLDVAFFEEEFQRPVGLYDTQSVWENREQWVNEILEAEGVTNPDYGWGDVRKYRILSDIVLEGMTEAATGMTENLADIINPNVGQELAVEAIESYRREIEEQHDRPVKIVLLLDEVTLFIGGNYQRLSELNALAESIGDIGQGNIISVVTAQSNIEDVQPGLAMKQLNFGILKDRFPQQYELPSRHVGEIVQQRLLTKSYSGQEWVSEEALNAPVHPQTMLVYREVTQNTEPPLDEIEGDEFVQYFPLLPYQPALFMEILSNLRGELADATKSIFSGTARAILALVAGLREAWAEKDGERPIISLVDFYDLVQYELEDIIPGKTAVIEDIEADAATTEFDVKVAKAVLLLSYIPNMVPQADANIAVAVMDDMEGQPRANLQTRVGEALEGNLEKYIRPDTSTDGSELRLTDREEQQLISAARDFEADPGWDRIVSTLDERLWDDVIAGLDLPQSYSYYDGEDAPAYPVGYNFTIDGQGLDTGGSEDAVFDIDVVIRGLRPDVDDDHIAQETLYWMIETEGIEELRSQLAEWWALIEATRSTNPPESLIRDRTDAAGRVVEKLTAALRNGGFTVEASEFTSIKAALADYIDESYPAYWDPRMSQIDESHLDELRHLEEGADLPDWARQLGVPQLGATDFATFSDVAFELRKLVGTEINESGGGLDVATVLDRVGEREPLFASETDGGVEPSPATLAVLWGLCRAGVFRVTTIDGEPAPEERLLERNYHTALSLAPITPGRRPKDVFVEYDIIQPTESGNQGYVNYDELLESIEARANALTDEVTVRGETTFETDTVSPIIDNLVEAVSEIAQNASSRRAEATTDDVDRLRELVESTRSDEAALETAEQRWSERFSFLMQLEGLLRIGSVQADWLGDDVRTPIADLEDQINRVQDTAWWTEDGWTEFASGLDARTEAIPALQNSWETRQDSSDLVDLQSELEDHPWLVGPMDLPAHAVHDGFRVRYLDPLRGFRTTIDRIEKALSPLVDPEPGSADEGDLTQALGLLDGGLKWSAVSDATVAERRDQLSTLENVVGGATPEDVVGIGVLHADADALRAQINALDVSEGLPEITEHDGGVVVR